MGLLALLAPAVARAHGGGAPVATDFRATISHGVPGLRVRAVDGDQSLWLAAGARSVLVLGVEDEPLLRFDASGVWVNLRSLSAQTDRIDPLALHPTASGRPPRWRRVSSGHAYLWHERRLYALEFLANGASTQRRLGAWVVPLLVDGRRTALDGALDYVPPPPGWLWPGAAIALALAGGLVARRRPGGAVAVAAVCLLAVWSLRSGRELYGRPFVGATGWLEVALTALVGVVLAAGLAQRDASLRRFTAFLVGLGGVYQATTMLAVLTHSLALSALPSGLARPLLAIALGCGVAAVAGWLRWPASRHALASLRSPRVSPVTRA